MNVHVALFFLLNCYQVIHHLCQSKETATLNSVCSLIVRKPEALDIICLFKTPAVVLSPLCTLLDEWKWGEVQSRIYAVPGALKQR